MRRLLLISLLLVGCATVKVGEHVLDKGDWERMEPFIKTRAAFDLKCSADAIELTILAAAPCTTAACAWQVGAEGCGSRAVYVRSPSGWVMNSVDGQPR